MVCRRGKQLIRRTALLGALAATMLAGLVTAAGAAARFGSALPSRAYVVGTFADGHLELDVNGVQVARRWVRGRLDHTRLPLEIGSFLGGAVWAGAIDEVAIYRRSLSASTIAAHYRLGTDLRPANPNAYRDLITHTPGLVSYWALDDSGRVAVDSYGHNNGVYTLGVTEGHPGLIAGERGAAAMFNGRSGSVRVTQSRSLNFERGFTLEAWVTTAVTGDKAIVARAGSYFLKTDALGHWRFGVYMGGRIFSIYSVVGTHGPLTPTRSRNVGQGRASLDPVWPLIIAAIVAVVLVARRGYGVRSSGPGKQPTQPHARKFPLVDSLRALAALGVLMTHASWFSGLNYRASPGRFTQRLDVGVALFFLISGLLLYRPFVLANLKRSSAPASGPYAWRRFLRIMPAYWLALTVTALTVGTAKYAPAVFTASGIPRYYLLAQDYSRSSFGGGLLQAWTLPIEVAFYAFLPVYAWLQRRSAGRTHRIVRTEAAGLVLLIVASEVWKWLALSSGSQIRAVLTPALVSLPGYLDQFALGMALALLSAWIEVRGRNPRWVTIFDRAPTVAWVLAGFAFWLVSSAVLPSKPFSPWSPAQYLERQWLYGVVALGLILPAVVGDQQRGLARRFLRLRALAWLGLISYGLYLWQLTIMEAMQRLGFTTHGDLSAYVAWPTIALALTALVAAASYYALERPALKLKRLVEVGGGKAGLRADTVEASSGARGTATAISTITSVAPEANE